MLKIPVTHKIGDEVQHSLNDMKFKVVWYNVIGDRVQYICLQSEKTDFAYMNEVELKPHKETQIWFYPGK